MVVSSCLVSSANSSSSLKIEGRAAGLSVEVWPDDGVWLRVRAGHELRLHPVERDGVERARWQRTDPHVRGGPRISEGDLGPVADLSSDALRTFIARWLSWRAAGG